MNTAKESGDDSWFISLQENCPRYFADQSGWSPLHVAVAMGRLSSVQRLLQREDIAIDLRTSNFGMTALYLAADLERLQICKCLLQNGAQPNISDRLKRSPLHIAAACGRLDCSRLLIEFGANVNAADYNGETPVFRAARWRLPDIVGLLIESGANLDIANKDGKTPLFAAAESRNLQCLRLIHKRLCNNGNVNVDVEDNTGMTPLMAAAKRGQLDCVQFLLDKGADSNHAEKHGYLALHLATQCGSLGCVKALLPHTSQYALLKACYGSQVTEDSDWLPAFLERVRGNCQLELPERGFSILHLAVDSSLEVLHHLLESGIHPDHYITDMTFVQITGGDREMIGVTALGLACHSYFIKDNMPKITTLLDHGAQFTLGHDLICNPLHCALLNRGHLSACFIRFLVERGADINSHMMDDDDSPAIHFALQDPQLLHELMALGGRVKNWDPEISGGVGRRLVKMARNPRTFGLSQFKSLLVLARFAPRHQFRPLYSTLQSMCQAYPIGLHNGWTNLGRELDSPQSLLQICRFKTREVIMMQRGILRESTVSTLPLPRRLQDYLMFR